MPIFPDSQPPRIDVADAVPVDPDGVIEPDGPYVTCDGCFAVAHTERWHGPDLESIRAVLPDGWTADEYDVFISRDMGMEAELGILCPRCQPDHQESTDADDLR